MVTTGVSRVSATSLPAARRSRSVTTSEGETASRDRAGLARSQRRIEWGEDRTELGRRGEHDEQLEAGAGQRDQPVAGGQPERHQGPGGAIGGPVEGAKGEGPPSNQAAGRSGTAAAALANTSPMRRSLRTHALPSIHVVSTLRTAAILRSPVGGPPPGGDQGGCQDERRNGDRTERAGGSAGRRAGRRPTRGHYRDEVRRIVDQTLDLIERTAELHPSLRQILAATGCPPRASPLFASKDELFLVLLDDGRRRLEDYLTAKMAHAEAAGADPGLDRGSAGPGRRTPGRRADPALRGR